MGKDNEPPFLREPWQRLLQDSPDAPPETTDARIRAKAQKAIASPAARWWLPASLAASVLLAVLIVHSQYGKDEKPDVVTESDVAVPAASAPAATGESSQAAREPAAEIGLAARKEPAPPEPQDETAEGQFSPEPEARVGGPEQELKAASEVDSAEAEQPAPAPSPMLVVPAMESTRDRAADAPAMPVTVDARTPEAWYADIEALRKAGRNTEADAELARFEAAYPGWLKQHGRRKP